VWIFNALYPLFILSMSVVFLAGDIILFFIAWEVMAISSYFLVIFEHENRANRNAGTLYLIMTHIGSAFLLSALIILYVASGTTEIAAMSPVFKPIASLAVLVMLLIGFATKAGAMPLHIWLPQAHPAAPANVSALMSGVMIKTAIYGIIRFMFEIEGLNLALLGNILLTAGAVTAVTGAAYAFMEKDYKKLLAYSSMENIGIIMVGLGAAAYGKATGNGMLAVLAISAALIHTFNHALFKSLLFMNAGSVLNATHTRKIDELGGLMNKMPVTGLLTLVGGLAASAAVPFNGFIGEWYTLKSLFEGIIINGNRITGVIMILCVASGCKYSCHCQ
jgi:formate hydrogenlyase subunit 3/multisubunit Na+/H+ antiporter MnhD subunit